MNLEQNHQPNSTSGSSDQMSWREDDIDDDDDIRVTEYWPYHAASSLGVSPGQPLNNFAAADVIGPCLSMQSALQQPVRHPVLNIDGLHSDSSSLTGWSANNNTRSNGEIIFVFYLILVMHCI